VKRSHDNVNNEDCHPDLSDENLPKKQKFVKIKENNTESKDRPEYFTCHICNMKMNDLYLMERHMNGHGLTREEDKVCDGRYQLVNLQQSDLPILKERFHPFSCDICNKLITSEVEGSEHQEECAKSNMWYKILSNNKFQCKICEAVMKRRIYLKNHLAFVHKVSLPYQCKECQDFFLTSSQLKDHRREHRQTQSGNTLPDYHLLTETKHLNQSERESVLSAYSSETPNEDVQCKICLKTFKKQIIESHLLDSHLNLAFYQCDACCQTFVDAKDFEIHAESCSVIRIEQPDDTDTVLNEIKDPLTIVEGEEELEINNEEYLDMDDEVIFEENSEKLIGNYHNIQGTVYLSWSKAKNIVDSYMVWEQFHYRCILCSCLHHTPREIREHLLGNHLNINIYLCPRCPEEFKFENEFKCHLLQEHNETIPEKSRKSKPELEDSQKKLSSEVNENNDQCALVDNVKRDDKVEEKFTPYHLLTQDLYVGAETGKKIVKQYYHQVKGRLFECNVCGFQSGARGVECHIFAKHLTHLNLYRCDVCGKQFRYSKKTYLSHCELHTVGKLGCDLCIQLNLNLDKKFTSNSLAAHKKRFHKSNGEEFYCGEVGCGAVAESPAHLRRHEIDQHSVSKETKFMCSICQHFFPSNFQLSSHMESCSAGRSRTLIRQLMSDCLTWEGKGVYRCNLCGESFHPPRPTASSLPKARNHVVKVHKKTHLRKAKMSWTQGVRGLNQSKKDARRRKNDRNSISKDTLVDEPELQIDETNDKENHFDQDQ